ncbi:MAG: twin-arginine translocase TatA/TatE family subunit [Anaerolineae bacterium]|nr:twin-arginine translocase TatA/TatE family subunit [Anaerolineae bacterium]
MFRHIGLPELLIILIVVVLLFGPGRIARIGSELGKSIRGFRDGLGSEKKEKDDESTSDKV